MLGRRFLILVAVLMGLTALAASVAPRDPALNSRDERRPTPTPAPQAAEPGSPAGPTTTVEHVISADAERPRRVVVTEGQLVELRIEGSELDSVQVLGRIEPIDPESPARFHILAGPPAEYPITLLESGRRIGTLAVREGS